MSDTKRISLDKDSFRTVCNNLSEKLEAYHNTNYNGEKEASEVVEAIVNTFFEIQDTINLTEAILKGMKIN